MATKCSIACASNQLKRPWRSVRGQRVFSGRECQIAQAVLHWDKIDLPIPPQQRKRLGREPVRLSVVHVQETDELNNAEAIESLLLTTLPVTTQPQAEDVIGFHRFRWRIEDCYKILESSCEVEKIVHTTATRVKRPVIINAVITRRLATLTLMECDTPGLPAEKMFSNNEIATLCDFATSLGIALPELAEGTVLPPLSLGQAVGIVARFGSYLNRKNDGAPGHQIIWECYTRLSTIRQEMERMIESRRDISGYSQLVQAVNQ